MAFERVREAEENPDRAISDGDAALFKEVIGLAMDVLDDTADELTKAMKEAQFGTQREAA